VATQENKKGEGHQPQRSKEKNEAEGKFDVWKKTGKSGPQQAAISEGTRPPESEGDKNEIERLSLKAHRFEQKRERKSLRRQIEVIPPPRREASD